MANTEKESVVKNLDAVFKNPDFLVFTGYKGLKVEELSDLRRKLAKENSSIRIIKNTLAKLGAKKAKREEMLPFLNGPVAIASSPDAENVNLAKVLINFAKSQPLLTIKGGILNGKILELNDLDNFAKLPDREVLLSQIRNGFLAPVTRLVFGLKGLIQSLLVVLKNIEKQKT